jgi:predicted RNA-binding protein YlqC (UPF0109 family)
VLKKLMQMIGGGKKASVAAPAAAAAAAPSGDKKAPSGVKDLGNFVDYVVRALVDKPESVKIQVDKLENSTVIRINCAKEDMGKVIGKNGKTIMAIRSLVSGAGGRLGQKLSVEVVE